jgi:hypothetical protein
MFGNSIPIEHECGGVKEEDWVRFKFLREACMKMRAFQVMSLMMEAVRTAEKSVYFYDTTWRHIPESFIFKKVAE